VQTILEKNNVNWIATEEDYDSTTANGRLHLNIKLSIAQDEADRTSERIKFIIAAKKANSKKKSVLSSIIDISIL
jgi:DNA invertase Pin-like site-specific DNA recombinase